jgi:hypothetical protein
VDVDITVHGDELDTNPAIPIMISICADVLVHMIAIMAHRHMKLKSGWTAPGGRSWCSIDSTAKKLQEQNK